MADPNSQPSDTSESQTLVRGKDQFFANTIGIIQAVLYFISVILSIIVVVNVGLTTQNFEQRCVLQAQVVWDNLWIYPTNESICNFVVYIGIGLGIAYASFMCAFSVWLAVPFTWRQFKGIGTVQQIHSEYMLRGINPVFTAINLVVMGLMFAVAIVLSYGFSFFCNQLLESLGESPTLSFSPTSPPNNTKTFINITSCADAQRIDWAPFAIIGGHRGGLDGSSFFWRLMLADITSWILVFVWLLILLVNCGMCCTRCSCEVAEEKREVDKALVIAQRRSRMATPIGTPGHMTPTRGRTPLPSVGASSMGRPYSPAVPMGPPPPVGPPAPHLGPPPPHFGQGRPMAPSPVPMGPQRMPMGQMYMGPPPMGGHPPPMRFPPPHMGGPPPRMMGGPPPMGYQPPPRGYHPAPGQMHISGLPPKASDSAC